MEVSYRERAKQRGRRRDEGERETDRHASERACTWEVYSSISSLSWLSKEPAMGQARALSFIQVSYVNGKGLSTRANVCCFSQAISRDTMWYAFEMLTLGFKKNNLFEKAKQEKGRDTETERKGFTCTLIYLTISVTPSMGHLTQVH